METVSIKTCPLVSIARKSMNTRIHQTTHHKDPAKLGSLSNEPVGYQ
jgi:hypothetical protein